MQDANANSGGDGLNNNRQQQQQQQQQQQERQEEKQQEKQVVVEGPHVFDRSVPVGAPSRPGHHRPHPQPAGLIQIEIGRHPPYPQPPYRHFQQQQQRDGQQQRSHMPVLADSDSLYVRLLINSFQGVVPSHHSSGKKQLPLASSQDSAAQRTTGEPINVIDGSTSTDNFTVHRRPGNSNEATNYRDDTTTSTVPPTGRRRRHQKETLVNIEDKKVATNLAKRHRRHPYHFASIDKAHGHKRKTRQTDVSLEPQTQPANTKDFGKEDTNPAFVHETVEVDGEKEAPGSARRRRAIDNNRLSSAGLSHYNKLLSVNSRDSLRREPLSLKPIAVLSGVQALDEGAGAALLVLPEEPDQQRWSSWGKWSPCSAECGPGQRSRYRHCIHGPRCSPGERQSDIMPCIRESCRHQKVVSKDVIVV